MVSPATDFVLVQRSELLSTALSRMYSGRRMEAHRSVERFEHGHRISGAGEGEPHLARDAALAVAVMAAFLAIAIFLSNERRAAAEADRHEARIAEQLKPSDARLGAQARSYSDDTDHANAQHIDYELAEVGLQVGIVLATVSIIARRRWLLGAGGAVATAGVALLLFGLLLA
jgi:hypothetical protein